MFKELYEKSLKLASHKSSNFFLAIISFIESFIFPIPPDVLILLFILYEICYLWANGGTGRRVGLKIQ